uniref:Uncharacterized protein n=1 Tax=Hucho hucho TaxID=62062 RepID=A0A4W5MP11_9TELE
RRPPNAARTRRGTDIGGSRDKREGGRVGSDKIQKVQTWKELFREFYTDLGHYADHYGTLKKAWDDLKRYLDQRHPRLIASLKGKPPQGIHITTLGDLIAVRWFDRTIRPYHKTLN